jgi:hypothetical protein
MNPGHATKDGAVWNVVRRLGVSGVRRRTKVVVSQTLIEEPIK